MSAISLTIYVQALGGKFLGPSACNPQDITITLAYNSNTIPVPYYTAPDNDGNVNTTFTAGATTPVPILTQEATGNPTVNYLTPGVINNTNTVCGQVTLPALAEYATATITVSVPVPIGAPLVFTQQIVLSPFQYNYRVTVPIPGLLLESPTIGNQQVSVYVKMMCGCKISAGSPWYPEDFTVSALLGLSDGSVTSVPLSLDAATPSLFTGSLDTTGNIISANFVAVQNSTGNSGWSVA